MSTSSANATALPDRRHFLSTIAGAGALSLPVLPAMAWTPGPIEALWPEYLRREAALDAVAERVMDADERYQEPDRPQWHPFYEEGGYKTVMTSPSRGISVLDDSAHNVAYLQGMIARAHLPDDPKAGFSNAPRAERARKTLAKIEAWNAEVRNRKEAAGLTEAEAAEHEATRAVEEAKTAIFVIEAATFRELAFQAAILDVGWRQADAERVLERLTVLAGIVPYGLG